MNKRQKLMIANAVLLALTLVINALGALGHINGLSQEAVSDEYHTYITPSGTTFSIWSVIYTLLIASLIVMYVKRDEDYYRNLIPKISPLFWITSVANIAWIISFSYVKLGLSTLFIIIFTVALTLILVMLKNVQEKGRWLLPLTFSLYTGWLYIATAVNIAATSVGRNGLDNGLSSLVGSVLLLIIFIVLVILVTRFTKIATTPLPMAWASLGIRNEIAQFNGPTTMKVLAIIAIIVLIGSAGIQFYLNHYTLLPGRKKQIN